jgi:3-phytase
MGAPARALLAAAILLGFQDAPVAVPAARETAPVRHDGDAADDPAVWVHPSDPALSLVLGDDKQGGLSVYDLDGRELQYVDPGRCLNNVDVRYGFPLAGTFADGVRHERVDLVGVGDETDAAFAFYKVNPRARRLEPAGRIPRLGLVPYGSCLYRSPVSGRFYAFVNAADGTTQQWELRDDGRGGVAGTLVRSFDVGGTVEGCVADDVLAKFYIGEEAVGIWKYGAEPGDGTDRVLVDRTGSGGRLVADVEGLALYYAGREEGYLIASSQGNDTFVVYERSGKNAYVGRFRIVAGAVDGVSDTDGIEVVASALGPDFPRGLFVAQDGSNTDPPARQNYKLVSWEEIARRFEPPLRVNPSWDPRALK